MYFLLGFWENNRSSKFCTKSLVSVSKVWWTRIAASFNQSEIWSSLNRWLKSDFSMRSITKVYRERLCIRKACWVIYGKCSWQVQPKKTKTQKNSLYGVACHRIMTWKIVKTQEGLIKVMPYLFDVVCSWFILEILKFMLYYGKKCHGNH